MVYIRSKKRRPAADQAENSRKKRARTADKISAWIKEKQATDPDPILRKSQHIILVFADFHEATIESAVIALDSTLAAVKQLLAELKETKLCLDSLVTLVPEQATAYLRWKEFKLEAAENQGDKESSNKSKVARAIAKLEPRPSDRFERRLTMLNEQSKGLNHDEYLAYATLRNCGFLATSTASFRKWLELEEEFQADKESLELLSFIAFDYLATLAELAKACKQKCGDQEETQEKDGHTGAFPLLESRFMQQAVEELQRRKLIIK